MQNPSQLLMALFLFFVFLCSSNAAFSQETKISTGTSVSEVTSSPVPDPRVSEVVKNINIARSNGDQSSKEYWENKLNELTHPQILTNTQDNLIYKNTNTPVGNPEKVLNLTNMTSGIIVANSVSRERVTGDIYAAIGFYGGAINPDTLKVFRSTDNGIHFTNISTVTGAGLKIPNNGIDVEAVSKGDSTFAFVGMSYTFTGSSYSFVYRVRQDGNRQASVVYGGTTTNSYTNARITSDNARYTAFTYIYFSVVLDSLNGGNRSFRSKLSRIENPFSSSMVLTSGYQSGLGLYGYGTLAPTPDSSFFQTDLAFVSTSPGDSNQLYTCTTVRGHSAFNGATLYFTRSNDFGATAPTLFNVADGTNLKESPRIAATGSHNSSLMVVARRLFAGGDWDPFYFYCPQINSATPTFSSGFVNSSADTTIGVSVVAKYGGNGSYLFAYNNRKGLNGSNILIKGANNTTFGSEVQSNPIGIIGTTVFGTPDAAFRNVNNDSCFVIWGGTVGIGSYVTGGCTGAFVGIGNNTTELRDFRLDQNYPNPFNPTTNISYNIPVSGLVKITVYDVLGSEVATVLNENKIAGYYSANFDGKNLASGAYYYKITFTSDNNSFSETKKMMLIK
ncbi:hypothetical protein BH10BAC5_BH10BAC5_07240 [soil metagenome]